MKRTIAFILSLMMVLSVMAVGLAGEAVAVDEAEFVVPKVVPAKGMEDFTGEWGIYLIIFPDGAEYTREDMLADGLINDRPTLIIKEDSVFIYGSFSGEIWPVKHEFVPENGSLKIIGEDAEDIVTLFLTDNGMLLYHGIEGNLEEGDSLNLMQKKETN